MARIKQLSPQEAQKIAAGEVVERPANIVKELVENALDAGATQISVYIQDSGKSLIRVVDNGCGMDAHDAQLCFTHHATSKITCVDDLIGIGTFGFRGEALSSISAVSKVTLITKEAPAQWAIKLELEQSIIKSQETISGNTGTDISICDLFYNIPARKKFLKSNETEWRHIIILFQALCLDYLPVHFKLYSQGAQLFNCPSTTSMQQRIAQLWDHTVANQMILIKSEQDGIILEGIISNHMYTRYDRSSLFFFINRRWVKNHILAQALLKGYMNVLPADKFPLASINLTIDPAHLDINIHPRKEEVQFLHPRLVQQSIQAAAKAALEAHVSAQLQKKVTFAPSLDQKIPSSSPLHFSSFASEFIKSPPMAPPIATAPPIASVPMPSANENQQPLSFASLPEKTSAHLAPQSSHYQIIGQFHKTYILIEQEESLFLVDQHAAHERILYEQFSSRFQKVPTIQLLFPVMITLTQAEMATLQSHIDLFAHNNIFIEIMGADQIIIQTAPVHLKEINLEELVRQTIGWINDYQSLEIQELHVKVNEKLHAQMACKAAVKAGDILTQAQMHQLLVDLEKTDNRFTCPHGRPTGWNLSLHEIEKKFKRKL